MFFSSYANIRVTSSEKISQYAEVRLPTLTFLSPPTDQTTFYPRTCRKSLPAARLTPFSTPASKPLRTIRSFTQRKTKRGSRWSTSSLLDSPCGALVSVSSTIIMELPRASRIVDSVANLIDSRLTAMNPFTSRVASLLSNQYHAHALGLSLLSLISLTSCSINSES